jgi:hypothetical protein
MGFSFNESVEGCYGRSPPCQESPHKTTDADRHLIEYSRQSDKLTQYSFSPPQVQCAAIKRDSMPHTYVRFVTVTIDWHSGRRQGVFQAAAVLVEANVLNDYELEELQNLRKWFNEHLNKPDRFSRSTRSNAARKAISWYKSSATQYITRMRSMCRILNDHDVPTEMLASARPGYIVFEDEHQIAAEPFAETTS